MGDGREWVYGPLCHLPGVLRVCVFDVCVCGVCGPPISFLRRGLIAGVLLVRLVLLCEELRTTAPLVLRCDELRTPSVLHIPPHPDLLVVSKRPFRIYYCSLSSCNVRHARFGRNEKSSGDSLKPDPDSWAELDPHERAGWGGAERWRSADGQVRGGVAMLPAEEGGQSGCFQTPTVQVPFCFWHSFSVG